MSLEAHALRGTKPRHGPKPPPLATVPVVRPAALPTTVSEGLGARGLELAAAIWSEYDGWRAVELVLLREAGLLVDQLETLRGQPAERTAQRTLLSVIAALGLER